MKRVVLTGATGAIGSALIRELISHNVEVLVLCRCDSLRNGNIINNELVKRKYCSLKDLSSLQNDTENDYDVFYHLAWEGTSGESRNDMHMQNRNVGYALDAVEVAKKFGCKIFVGAGSQAEYGRVEGVLKPDTPVFPETGYGMAKLCAGQMTREYSHKLGMKHIWMRILSVYGPNDGSQSMVASTISKLEHGETPKFTKGEQLWDYLYSGDAAEAFYLAGEKGIDGKTYVLGSGTAKPLSEYIYDIRDIVAPKADIGIGELPYSDRQVMHLQADISEINKDTDWKAKTSFKDGIRKIILD